MAQIIPIFQNVSSKFSQDTILDGIPITITLQWNSRAGYWFLSISNEISEIKSKKLVANWAVLRRNKSFFPDLPGDIIALKSDLEAGPEITYDNLGTGWVLAYLTEEEVNSWEDFNGLR